MIHKPKAGRRNPANTRPLAQTPTGGAKCVS